MKYTFVILFSLFFVSEWTILVNAAQAIALPHPLRKPGGCYDESLSHLKAGEQKRMPKDCVLATCEQDGSITYFSCGSIAATDSNCEKTEIDLSKSYPECCPKIICKKSKS